MLHVLVVQNGQPVVEHKVARDAVEVAGQPDGKGERDDPARSRATRGISHFANLHPGGRNHVTCAP